MEREAAMVEEAGRRGREWLDWARDPDGRGGARVDVVEKVVVEAVVEGALSEFIYGLAPPRWRI